MSKKYIALLLSALIFLSPLFSGLATEEPAPPPAPELLTAETTPEPEPTPEPALQTLGGEAPEPMAEGDLLLLAAPVLSISPATLRLRLVDDATAVLTPAWANQPEGSFTYYWSVAPESATIISVSDEQNARTTVTALSAGTATVQLVAVPTGPYPNFTATCQVTVTDYNGEGFTYAYSEPVFSTDDAENPTTFLTEWATEPTGTVTYSWTSSNPAVASVVDSNADLALVIPVAPGQATITATCKRDETVIAATSALVTVKGHATGIALSMGKRTRLFADIGDTVRLQATLLPAGFVVESPSDVVYELVPGETTATDATLSDTEKGLVEAGRELGNIRVKATLPGLAGVEATIDIPVVNLPLTSLAFFSGSFSLHQQETLDLAGQIRRIPLNATEALEWSSNAPAIATVENGVVTGLVSGTAKITAKGKESGVYTTCAVTVTSPAATHFDILKSGTEIVTGLTVSLPKKATLPLTARLTPSTCTDKPVWTSGNPLVASISSTGLVVAKMGGTAQITATVGTLQKTCDIYVDVPLTSISLRGEDLLRESSASPLDNVIRTPADATDDLTCTMALIDGEPGEQLSDILEESKIASGVLSVLPGARGGAKIQVTVTSARNPAVKTTAIYKVSVPLEYLSFTGGDSFVLKVGETSAPDALGGTFVPADATDVVTWTSSNTSVFRVVETRSVSDGTRVVIQGVGSGGAFLFSHRNNIPFFFKKVYVHDTPTKIVIPASKKLHRGYYGSPFAPNEFIVTHAGPFGSFEFITLQKSPGGSDSIGVGDGQPLVGVAADAAIGDRAKVYLQYDDGQNVVKSNECEIIVGNPVQSIALTCEADLSEPANTTVGKTYVLTASYTPLDTDDTEAEKKVTWASSNPRAASIDQNGKLTLLAPGRVTISGQTATGADHSLSFYVWSPSTAIKFPKTLTLKKGSSYFAKPAFSPAMPGKEFEFAAVDLSGDEELGTGNVLSLAYLSGLSTDLTAQSIGRSKFKLSVPGFPVHAECIVTVIDPTTKVALQSNKVWLNQQKAETAFLSIAALVPARAENSDACAWSVAPAKNCPVEIVGAANGHNLTVKAVKPGKATVTLKMVNGAKVSKSASFTLYVYDKPPTSIALPKAAKTSCFAGASLRLTPTFAPANSYPDPSLLPLKWTTDDSTVLTVNENTGLITPLKAGVANVTVKIVSTQLSATCKVTVTAPTKTLTLDQKVLTLSANRGAPDNKGALRIAQLDPAPSANGFDIKWSTDNKYISVIPAADGMSASIQGWKSGKTSVTVTVGAKKATASVFVTAPATAMTVKASKPFANDMYFVEHGKTISFSAKITAPKGCLEPVSWESSNPEALALVKPGTFKATLTDGQPIVVTATTALGHQVSCNVQVVNRPVSIKIIHRFDPVNAPGLKTLVKDLTTREGNTETPLRAVVTYANPSLSPTPGGYVTWSASDSPFVPTGLDFAYHPAFKEQIILTATYHSPGSKDVKTSILLVAK